MSYRAKSLIDFAVCEDTSGSLRTSLRSILRRVPRRGCFAHEVDKAGCPPVADAQAALQERDAAAALADHDLDDAFVHVVAGTEIVQAARAAFARRLELDQFRGVTCSTRK